MSQRNGRRKQKNSKRSHNNRGTMSVYTNSNMYEVSKQMARPKKSKLRKAIDKILGGLKRGDR